MNTKREFITLQVSTVGWVVHGLGGGVHGCLYRGKPLLPFLKEVWKKIFLLKKEINDLWEKIDREHPEKNEELIAPMLAAGAWAYALTLELQPYQEACVHGPTNPLRHFYIIRLEEIYMKCFAAAHMYGTAEQSMIGLRGLLVDFEVNGGINNKTGEVGDGFATTTLDWFLAYINTSNYEPATYASFGILWEQVSVMVMERYPKASPALHLRIDDFLTREAGGFASTTIQSPAKATLVKKLMGLKEQLARNLPQDKSACSAKIA